jgi:tight adherence protein C
MIQIFLIFILLTLSLAAMAWAGFELFGDRTDPLADRLVELQSQAMANATRTPRRRGGGFLNSFLYIISSLGGDGWLGDVEDELAQAGMRQRRALAFYALFHVGFLLILVSVAIYLEWNADFAAKLGGVLPAVMLGWLIPQQVLHRMVKRYRRKLQDALPDTVDLLSIVLGTGLGLDQAMLRVADEMEYIYPELASEFSVVVMQVKAGQERSKAFDQLVKRTGIEDIKSLAGMIVQSERFGTSLSQSLLAYTEGLRNTRKLRAEATISKAGIKMLFPIVLFVLPALFVITLVPGLLSVMHDLRQGFGPPR